MASLPLGPCCLKASLHEGTPKGSYSLVGGLDSYQVGREYGNERVLVLLTDVFGHKFTNTLLIADSLSVLGEIQVLVPDILNNDPVDPNNFDREKWLSAHSPEITTPIVTSFLSELKKNTTSLFAIGYCFGARFVIRNLTSDGVLLGGAIAHPSGVSIEEVQQITKPILISSGDNDNAFNEELRNQTIHALTESKVKYQLDLFQGCDHGYAVRGDISIPQVKYAKEKTVIDQVLFFKSIE